MARKPRLSVNAVPPREVAAALARASEMCAKYTHYAEWFTFADDLAPSMQSLIEGIRKAEAEFVAINRRLALNDTLFYFRPKLRNIYTEVRRRGLSKSGCTKRINHWLRLDDNLRGMAAEARVQLKYIARLSLSSAEIVDLGGPSEAADTKLAILAGIKRRQFQSLLPKMSKETAAKWENFQPKIPTEEQTRRYKTYLKSLPRAKASHSR